jgi:hypothetical protein
MNVQPPGDRYPNEYQYEEMAWEGDPEMQPGLMEDGEVGPPSGIFAKIKRALGFKR